MLKRIAALVLSLALVGCAAKVGSRANYREFTVAKHWAYAQYWLAERTGGHSYDVPYAIFHWSFRDKAAVIINEEEQTMNFALGRFNPETMSIEIALPFVAAHVIEHEACHAILFVLDDSGWIEWCHAQERPWYDLKGEHD